MSDSISIIELANGGLTIVDSDLHDWLSKWVWRQSDHGYAYCNEPKGPYKQEKIYLHALINGTPKGFKTDHVNRCKLDNRRSNLRTTTASGNNRNVGKKMRFGKSTSSKFKGVYRDKRGNKWVAGCNENGKTICLGRFDSEEEAASVYNARISKSHGDFAVLNTFN